LKRLAVLVVVLVLAAALLSVPLVLLHLAPAPASKIPRQVDPAIAPSEIVYGPGLFVFYGSVIASIDAGNLTGVKALLSQTGFIHIPSDISDAVNTFNGLLNSTANVLNATNTELLAANSFLSTGRAAKATPEVQAATSDLRVANGTITQLQAAAPLLASLTGIPSTLFVQKVDTIATLYKSYLQQVQSLQSQITGLTMLVQTVLTLAVTPSAVETGSEVNVSGSLATTKGGPLASKNVTVFLFDSILGRVNTDSLGRFSASLSMPFLYQNTVSLFASYLPTGNDTGVYSPSSSPPVQVNLTFSSPNAAVTLPKSVLAGQSIDINGTLGANGVPLPGYIVSMKAFALDLVTKSTQVGAFSFRAVAPASLNSGTYALTLQTSGNSTVGPLIRQLQVNVIKFDPKVTISVPAFAIAGLGTPFSGIAEDNGSELQGASVLNVGPGPSINTTTSGSGSFAFSVTPPFTITTGEWVYTVGVYPQQTWVSPTRVNVTVYVINPLTLVLPAASGGLLLLIVRRGRRPRQLEMVAVQEEATLVPAPLRPKETHPGVAGVYFSALELVQKTTSLGLQPHQTLREYLDSVRSSLKGFEHFEYITFAHETQLYGPGVSPQVESRAQEELDSLRRALEN